jgi:prephenate dehydrogenase
MRFRRVAVIGVGLIGGSFALALKKARLAGHIVGAGRSRANLRRALKRRAIDSIAASPAAAAENADLIMIATPVSHFPRIFSSVRNKIKSTAILTDAGSTKRDVVAAARKGLGRKVSQFVPGHPIAGAEKSGVGAASGDLFEGKRVVLTPIRGNPPARVRTLEKTWSKVKAKVSTMSPREHDEVFAAVSHLPHLLAYGLVSDIAGRRNAKQLFGYAAGGFRDFTRIASSHPEMWRDICVANGDCLLHELSLFERRMKRIRSMLKGRRARALEKTFAAARLARDRWLKGRA